MFDIPVVDCGEALVDVRELPELALDRRQEDPAGAWARLRVGVAERLVRAQAALPTGVQLLVVEGHRPVALQQHYFDDHRAELAQAHPDWTPDVVFTEASKHVSPPAVAPHPCGAAVDLTLTKDGIELDMGSPINATPEASAGACFTAADNITAEAREWRSVLGSALTEAGLVNYEPEWWHWSYGDRYWAAVTNSPNALYAPL
ncbi:M15 family metallopeptidase [Kribbella sp. NPDC056345]|uniref:M15 family metallopeptidase n=1 Tax=Kribbella sp. NPDC056345 TaxID=3345789 RepID=UPI0035D894D8